MALEMYVFYRGKLPSKTGLARAMRELGFPLNIVSATSPLEAHTGFMPIRWRGEDTGFEFDVTSDSEEIKEFIAQEGVDPSLDHLACFRFRGDMTELLAAQCAAAALAKLTDGIVFETEAGEIWSLERSIAEASKTLAQLTAQKKSRPRGTRPADIKHYLKPLLKMRDDLMLRGRFLFIQPVRHLLRGVRLVGNHSDQFELWRTVQPLHGEGYMSESIGFEEVWQPDFEARLIDRLKEDVFDYVGQITTFNDLASEVYRRNEQTLLTYDESSTWYSSLILAGEVEKVEAHIARLKDHPSQAARVEWLEGFLKQDVATICATYHEGEAKRAEALELGDAWDRSPFPIELLAADRVTRTSEAAFASTPWIPRPNALVDEAPDKVGEIAFARKWSRRKGRIIRVGPVSRDQAKAMHDNFERYCLFARLRGGELVVLQRWTGTDTNDPDRPTNPNYTPLENYWLWIHGAHGLAHADFFERDKASHRISLQSVQVRSPRGTTLWQCYAEWEDQQITVYNDQWSSGTSPQNKRMGDLELQICGRALPKFGEYEDMVESVNAFLELVSYGRYTR